MRTFKFPRSAIPLAALVLALALAQPSAAKNVAAPRVPRQRSPHGMTPANSTQPARPNLMCGSMLWVTSSQSDDFTTDQYMFDASANDITITYASVLFQQQCSTLFMRTDTNSGHHVYLTFQPGESINGQNPYDLGVGQSVLAVVDLPAGFMRIVAGHGI